MPSLKMKKRPPTEATTSTIRHYGANRLPAKWHNTPIRVPIGGEDYDAEHNEREQPCGSYFESIVHLIPRPLTKDLAKSFLALVSLLFARVEYIRRPFLHSFPFDQFRALCSQGEMIYGRPP
jgi:hypothetical protein